MHVMKIKLMYMNFFQFLGSTNEVDNSAEERETTAPTESDQN